MMKILMISMVVASAAAINTPDYMGVNKPMKSNGEAMTTPETMNMFATNHAMMVGVMQHQLSLLESSEQESLHAEMDAHKVDVARRVRAVRHAEDVPTRSVEDFAAAIKHVEDAHAAFHAENKDFHVTHKDAIASFMELHNARALISARGKRGHAAAPKKTAAAPKKTAAAPAAPKKTLGKSVAAGGAALGETIDAGVAAVGNAATAVKKGFLSNVGALVKAVKAAFQRFVCLTEKIIAFIVWAGQHIFFGADFKIGLKEGVGASFSLSWGQPLTKNPNPTPAANPLAIIDDPNCEKKDKCCGGLLNGCGWGISDADKKNKKIILDAKAATQAVAAGSAGAKKGDNWCCNDLGAVNRGANQVAGSIEDIFSGTCGKDTKDASDEVTDEQRAKEAKTEAEEAKKSTGIVASLIKFDPVGAAGKAVGTVVGQVSYVQKCPGAGIRLVFGLGAQLMPPFVMPSFGLGLSSGLIQCFGKIVYNVVGGEVAAGANVVAGAVQGAQNAQATALIEESSGFAPIPADADFHDLTTKIVAIENKWTSKICQDKIGKGLVQKGLCFLTVVIMKTIKFVFVTLASTIKKDCIDSIGLGAGLFPTPFTGFGIEFNTLACGMSALEKIGNTFADLLTLLFKDPVAAEQSQEAAATESAAAIAKRRKESMGPEKGSVMFNMFEGLDSCRNILTSALTTVGVDLLMSFSVGVIFGPASDVASCLTSVVWKMIKSLFHFGTAALKAAKETFTAIGAGLMKAGGYVLDKLGSIFSFKESHNKLRAATKHEHRRLQVAQLHPYTHVSKEL